MAPKATLAHVVPGSSAIQELIELLIDLEYADDQPCTAARAPDLSEVAGAIAGMEGNDVRSVFAGGNGDGNAVNAKYPGISKRPSASVET